MIDIKIARRIVEKGFDVPSRDLSADAYGRVVRNYIVSILDEYEEIEDKEMDNVKWELDDKDD